MNNENMEARMGNKSQKRGKQSNENVCEIMLS